MRPCAGCGTSSPRAVSGSRTPPSSSAIPTAAGALIGGFLTFAFPLVGAAIGAAAGAAIGAAMGRGVSGDFVDEVKGTLTPGRSAVFLVVREADADAVVAGLRDYRGEVLQSTVSVELEDALKAALR